MCCNSYRLWGVLEGIGQPRFSALLIPNGVRAVFGAGEPFGPPRVFPETLVSDHMVRKTWSSQATSPSLQQVCDMQANPRYRDVHRSRAHGEGRNGRAPITLTWMTEVTAGA